MSKTYLELYPNSISGGTGLIRSIAASTYEPFGTLTQEQQLEIERAYGVRSGFKTVIDTFANMNTTDRFKTLLVMYGEKWKRLLADYNLEYNPLDAYKVTETGENTRNNDYTDTTDYGKSVSSTGTDSGTVGTSETGTSANNYNTFGYNSSTPVPVNTESGNTSGNSTETRDLSNTNNRSESGTDTFTRDQEETTTHTITKVGNIGYSSPQELIRQEFEIWSRPFFDIVFTDIDNFITLQVY